MEGWATIRGNNRVTMASGESCSRCGLTISSNALWPFSTSSIFRDRLAPKVEALAGTLGSQIWLSDVHLLIFTGDQTAQHLQDWEDDIRRDMTRLIGEDRGDPVDYFLLSGAQGMRISFTPMAADNIPVIPAQPAEKELPPALTGFRRTSVTDSGSMSTPLVQFTAGSYFFATISSPEIRSMV